MAAAGGGGASGRALSYSGGNGGNGGIGGGGGGGGVCYPSVFSEQGGAGGAGGIGGGGGGGGNCEDRGGAGGVGNWGGGGGGGGSYNGIGGNGGAGGFGGGGGGGGDGSPTVGLGGAGGFGAGSGSDSLGHQIGGSGGGGAGMGGAIFNYAGTVAIINSTLSGNTAQGGAGGNNGACEGPGIAAEGGDGLGGAIFNEGGSITLLASTLAGNAVVAGAAGIGYGGSADGIPGSADAGGIYNFGTLTVINSTFSDNSATSSGGGIFNFFSGTLTVINNTFSSNSAGSGGGIFNYGTLNYANTIIANSTSGGDCVNSSSGTIGTNTNNLVEDGSCLATFSGDPQLGALANNGGATQTFALQPNSPAIDRGDAATCAASAVNGLDQRSQARNDLQCDIGAYELQMSDSNTTTLTPETTMRTFGPPRVGIQYNGTNPGSTTVTKVTGWAGGQPANALGAWWDITPTTNTGLNLTLKLCYSDAELGSLTESDLRFWRYSDGTWSQVADIPTFSGTSPNRCAQISGVTALSRWTLATGRPTAVTLSSFRAQSPWFDWAAWLKGILQWLRR